jgi:hypothetical protein
MLLPSFNVWFIMVLVLASDRSWQAIKHGAFFPRPAILHLYHFLDVGLCKSLEKIFEGKDVLDLGAGFGQYGRCWLRIKEPILKQRPEADEIFNK